MPQARQRVSFEVPWRTLFKIIAAAALVWAALRSMWIILLLVVAAMLAITIDPVVRWLEARGFGRATASTIVSVVILLAVGGFLWGTWASLNDQVQYLSQHMEEVSAIAADRVPDWLKNVVGSGTGTNVSSWLSRFALQFAQSLSSAVTILLLGFILTIFLLIEGKPTYRWLIAFVPLKHREKVHRTAAECQDVVFAYWKGNIITSIIATVVTLAGLWALDVPAALLLAVMAGLSDFVPVIGFVVSSIPAILIALTVSVRTALLVIVLYVVYNVVETYLISPWAYGSRMKLSNVAVILAFAIGAQLGGVVGALIALPIAAIYPVIERIWLREKLGDQVVQEHRAIERKAG